MRGRRGVSWLIGALCACVLLSAGVLSFPPWGAADLAPGLTLAALRQVKLGMTEGAVTSLLGPPLQRRSRSDGSEVWEFHRTIRAREYPTVSVVLRDHQVNAVFVEVERFWGIDEDTLYLLTPQQYFLLPEIHRWVPDA